MARLARVMGGGRGGEGDGGDEGGFVNLCFMVRKITDRKTSKASFLFIISTPVITVSILSNRNVEIHFIISVIRLGFTQIPLDSRTT